jgi:hypothetical protein
MPDLTQNVRVRLPNGAQIWVETLSLGPREADVAFPRVTEVLSLDAVRQAIEGVAALVHDTLEKAKPDKASVEFGLELGVETGQLCALWVKGSGKANLKVTLSWDKSSARD